MTRSLAEAAEDAASVETVVGRARRSVESSGKIVQGAVAAMTELKAAGW